ncbi:hypothetical protein AAHA92_00518 [Salvia divinorum]|uniref:Uncharacterized protein n=1 Tax=Salvia divinorum TaxID=28513 RepID=A0ABD1IJT9_SALDI
MEGHHQLPPPFHTRDFNLQQQFHQNSQDEQSETSSLNTQQKRNSDDTTIGGSPSAGKMSVNRRLQEQTEAANHRHP